MKPIYRETAPDVFELWRGEKINGVSHPRNIGALWSKTELKNKGLFIPADPKAMPVGHREVSRSVQRVGTVVKWVLVTEEIPAPSTDPRDYGLSRAQFEYLLIDAELDDYLEAAKASTKSARGNSAADKEAEAQFKMALQGNIFDFDMTLAMIVSMAAHMPVGVTIDEVYLTPFWLKAAAK